MDTVNTKIKKHIFRLLIMLTSLFISTAQSAPLLYTFDLRVDSVTAGDVAIDDIFMGNFIIDDNNFSGVGIEDFSPSSPPSTGELLSFDITILNNVFSSVNDFGFPVFPSVIFEDGSVIQMEFESTTLDPQLTLFLTASGIEFAYAEGPFGEELQQFTGLVENISTIPVPPALYLFIAGLSILGKFTFTQRRKKVLP